MSSPLSLYFYLFPYDIFMLFHSSCPCNITTLKSIFHDFSIQHLTHDARVCLSLSSILLTCSFTLFSPLTFHIYIICLHAHFQDISINCIIYLLFQLRFIFQYSLFNIFRNLSFHSRCYYVSLSSLFIQYCYYNFTLSCFSFLSYLPLLRTVLQQMTVPHGLFLHFHFLLQCLLEHSQNLSY